MIYILFISIFFIASIECGVQYKSYSMEVLCDRQLILDCPPTTGLPAGWLIFSQLPFRQCSIRITLPTYCSNYAKGLAIYLNVQTLNIPKDDTIFIFEPARSPHPVKQLWPSIPRTAQGDSLAQILSLYGDQPTLLIQYNRSQMPPDSQSYQVIFQYAILRGDEDRYSDYCPALGGYIRPDYLCDTSRINCPQEYSETVGPNPARPFHCLASSSTPFLLPTTRIVVKTTAKPATGIAFSPGVITLIVIASILALSFWLALLHFFFTKYQNKMAQQQAAKAAFLANQHSAVSQQRI